jgi:predicted metal-dependent hydrolase
MTKHEILYGKHKIEFILNRKDVKNINLNLKPNLIIEVSAHKEVPLDKIHSFVKKKASWILKNKEYFMRAIPEIHSEKEFVNGETFKYLGKQYRLKIYEDKNEDVKCKGGFLNIYVQNKNDFAKKSELLKNWYTKNRIRVYQDSLDRMYKIIKKYDIEKPNINIRHMKTRWGSCFESKRIIILNSELIYAPKFCIDYVILHELIHLRYRNHDKSFYKLLDTLMPDWKKRKEILDIEIVKDL